MRYGGKETLYDVLDLPRDASAEDIVAAHRRLTQVSDDARTPPPDARRMALLHEAYEVLADRDRRAAYDASLLADPVVTAPSRRLPARWVAAAIAIAALGIAAFVLMRHRSHATAVEDEIFAQANVAVARVQAIDVAGRKVPVAFATAVEEGTMATTCHGLVPGAQLMVNNGTLAFGATITIADYALDICKLSVAGGASKPATLSLALPRVGDKLYVVRAGPDGGLVLEIAAVTALVATANGQVIVIDKASPAPQGDGAAAFDAQGRLVGITTSKISADSRRDVVLPSAWIGAARSRGISGHQRGR
jgi:hypothetical protein